jgi:hypothetical protein
MKQHVICSGMQFVKRQTREITDTIAYQILLGFNEKVLY